MWNCATPITPAGDILQVLVEGAVLQVFGADNTSTSAGIYQIIEFDGAGTSTSTGPGGGNRSAKFGVTGVRALHGGKLDRVDLDAVKDLCTTLSSVSENQFIGFGSNDIPCVIVRPRRQDEVGVYSTIQLPNSI